MEKTPWGGEISCPHEMLQYTVSDERHVRIKLVICGMHLPMHESFRDIAGASDTEMSINTDCLTLFGREAKMFSALG